jgi:type II secretory pathway component GspD/PulD (secretin)
MEHRILHVLRSRVATVVAVAVVIAIAGYPTVSPPSRADARAAGSATDVAGRHVEVFRAGGLGADHAAAVLRKLYPHASIEADRPSNSVIVVARAAELNEMRRVIHALVAGAPATPAPPKTVVVTLSKAAPNDVARAVARQFPGVRTNVLGRQIALSGAPDEIDRAAALVTGLDAPPSDVAFSRVYRVHSYDATSVASLLGRTFPGVTATADAAFNAVTVVGTPEQQDRVADAIAQLDGGARVVGAAHAPGVAQPGSASQPVTAPDGTTIEVVTLRAAIPAANGGASTSASDIATVLGQTLQRAAPSLHVTTSPSSPQIILNGTPQDVELGKELIAQLDVTQKLVVLDTQVYEVDETDAKNLGLQLTPPAGSTSTQPYIGSTYSEIVPAAPLTGGTPPPLLGLQALTRTPLSLGFQLNLAVQKGIAKVLANPRITTISGRTATIRAGENITVLTTAGGSAGTVATTQLQTFQTGVSLDITPIVNSGNYISVTLHPTVNSLSGTNNGLPQISTRDTQTTVLMQAEQTLVIGGLIQDSYQLTETKIPLLGDLPLIGRIFRNSNKSAERDELIIVVTPHIVTPGEEGAREPWNTLPQPPGPQSLPTLPPDAHLSAKPVGRRVRGIGVLAPSSPYTPAPSPVPAPTPSAFAQANQFVYGKPPQSTFAAPGDSPQIFFASLSPTIVKAQTPMHVAAITTSNVTKVTIGVRSFARDLSNRGAGLWQADIPFDSSGVFPGETNIQLTLTAAKADGTTATLQIPVSYSP